MDLGRAYTFAFEDPEWASKVGLGALMSMVPGLNLVVLGYEVQVARNVARGDARPLPPWNQLERLFVDGFWLWLAQLIYALPVLGLAGCGFLALLPTFFFALQGQTDEQTGPRFVLFVGVFLIELTGLMVVSFIMGLVFPAVTAQYVRRGQFGACFRFGEMWRLAVDNLSTYLLLWLGVWVAGVGLSLVVAAVGTIANFIPCFGTFLYLALLGAGVFAIWLISGHLTGQLLQADAARATALEPLLPGT
jgi:Protein of unknown function (DUF4013)